MPPTDLRHQARPNFQILVLESMGREAVTPRDFLMSLSSFRWSTLTAAGQAAAAAAAEAAAAV